MSDDDTIDIGPPRAWLVIDARGKDALFLREEKARAEQYAAEHRGNCYALYLPVIEETEFENTR